MSAWARFSRHRPALISLVLLGGLAALCLGAPLFTAALGVDPYTPDAGAIREGPSAAHWLGTDDLGRDVLARLLYGGRISLAVAFTAVLAALVLGASLGFVSGYRGGAVDAGIMRFTEAVMALPKLPIMIVLTAVDLAVFGASSLGQLVVIIVLFGWMSAARLARAATLSIRRSDYVSAARGFGASTPRILAVHVLPNTAAPLVVAATLDLGEFIIYESVLSFLGLGIPPPEPSWGNMLAGAMTHVASAPHLVVWPGLLTFVTVAAFNFVGDGLRDALDVRL